MYLIVFSILCSLFLGFLLYGLIWVVNLKAKKSFLLSSIFECGFSSWSEKLMPFSLQFFLTALVFLIFDVELVLMFPFLTMALEMFWLSSKILALFIMMLFLGLIYEWNNKALDWKN